MDRSRTMDFLIRHVKPLADFLCVGHYKLTVDCKPLPDGTRAEVELNPTYEFATILFDADKFKTDDELLDSLHHELCHVVLAPIEAYFKFAAPHFAEGTPLAASERSVRIHAEEQIVCNLERIWRSEMRDVYLDKFTSGKSN